MTVQTVGPRDSMRAKRRVVGPGTIATASSAGAIFGYALVWALLFSVLATTVLQEMAVRQALVTRQGLATTLRRSFAGSWLGRVAVLPVIAAIGLGNAAYESGNIAGAALALQGIGVAGQGEWAVLIGAGKMARHGASGSGAGGSPG